MPPRHAGHATLLVVTVRMALAFPENQAMLPSRDEAPTDALTGLGNRRSLMEDLEAMLRSRPERAAALLVLFDLDGFKGYNDTFGHPAGDALLARLGSASTAPCAVRARLPPGRRRVLRAGALRRRPASRARGGRARAALSERGEGFAVTASAGAC